MENKDLKSQEINNSENTSEKKNENSVKESEKTVIEKTGKAEKKAEKKTNIVEDAKTDETQQEDIELKESAEIKIIAEKSEKSLNNPKVENIELVSSEKIEEELETEENSKNDYSALSKEELIATLEKLIDEKDIEKIRLDVDNIKINFYKKHKAEVVAKKNDFIKEGGEADDFVIEEDKDEIKFKEVYKKYKTLKTEYNEKLQQEKDNNLEAKYTVIQSIEDLINNEETFEKTFREFRELQKRWREIGLVPQKELKRLWEKYNYTVEKFYDYVNINKELRDLDFKKNLEIKIKLCEKAEELLLEPFTTKIFNTLQEYHNQWREIGPVPKENREDLWQRFKEATSKINKKQHEYFQKIKEEQENNLKSKTVLCEKVENITSLNLIKRKKWEEKTREVIEIQKLWRTIGFAPKKHNNKIYSRFVAACDLFFNKKREFYEKLKKEQEDNLQLKTDLCVQAEALKESTEWKKTSIDFIQLQKKWKEIGPAPRKHAERIWRRFRTACDYFFNKKAEFYSSQVEEEEDNLKLKEQLILDLEKFEPTDDVKESLKLLFDFEKKWTKIGYVPFKKKDELQKRFKKALDDNFSKLNIDRQEKDIIEFKNKFSDISSSKNSRNRIDRERSSIITKLKELENEVLLFENNLGFFAKSKNADVLIADMNKKIERLRKEITTLKQKLRLLNNL
ncbi:MAG: DUF349 domain-containing protein [Bacteroidetes bacterium]|nr:MAG: DUF349 domain-containing protein [Bacteroidota bacterium]